MSKQDIPDITPEERVVRIIFHPFHIQNNGKLKRGAFLPPHNSNEVSVQRLLLFSSNSCKREGQRMASEHNKKQSKRKEYVGLGLLYVCSILESDVDIEKAPSKKSDGHANILFKDKLIRHEPTPPQMIKAINRLLKRCKYYHDPDPNSTEWEGGELI